MRAAEQLRAAGERVTPQRMLVAETLGAAGRQVTAQELWERVRRRLPGVGRATVFRTLEALVNVGAARRLELDGHVSTYVACAPRHHHHLSCTWCGRVEEVEEGYVRQLIERLAGDRGFLVDDARLDFYGRCARCATESDA